MSLLQRAKAKEKMPGPDDYDIKVRMLQMEGKAQVRNGFAVFACLGQVLKKAFKRETGW